jgi:hypothetical protein
MNLSKLEKLFFSDEFSAVDAYSLKFDLFKMMGVRSKELIHSNILACLLDPTYPHGLNHLFLNSFIKAVPGLKMVGKQQDAEPLPLSTLIAATNQDAKVYREQDNIDLVIEFASSRLVLAIENKIWAGEQSRQIERYQETLASRYNGYKAAMIFLTPDGRAPETINPHSSIPVYCMSYGRLAYLLKPLKEQANDAALHFIEQFINHIEVYMAGNDELKELCWQLFDKHEDAYEQLVKYHDYCIGRRIKDIFGELEQKLRKSPAMSQWSSKLETTSSFEDDKKCIIKCDLDIRLDDWPEGLWVKVYKHHWFGVYPYVDEESKDNVIPHVPSLDCRTSNIPNRYYVSHRVNLDKERAILKDGNKLSNTNINAAVNRVLEHIEEIEAARMASSTDQASN